MILAKVYVTLKPGVLDAQGAVIQRALAQTGFHEVVGVRVGKYIEVTLRTDDMAQARAQVRQMGERLLSNPVIEQFRLELEQVAEAAPGTAPVKRARRTAGARH